MQRLLRLRLRLRLRMQGLFRLRLLLHKSRVERLDAPGGGLLAEDVVEGADAHLIGYRRLDTGGDTPFGHWLEIPEGRDRYGALESGYRRGYRLGTPEGGYRKGDTVGGRTDPFGPARPERVDVTASSASRSRASRCLD